MLILSRAPGERIVIGENVVLTIVRCWGRRVQIGIQAPTEMSVRRAETIASPLSLECQAGSPTSKGASP
jgi:carbon storage regulator